MKILVTGGNGMLGKNLRDVISRDTNENNWLFPRSTELNLLDKECVDKYIKENRPDFIIHLAANVGGLFKNLKYGVELFRENIRMNENLLECCNKYNVNNGIFCCSTCIFPDKPRKYPMTEDMMMEGEPHHSNSGYAYAKRMLYVQCQNYNKQYDRKYICVTPCNMYGIYDNFNLEDCHVFPALIRRFYEASICEDKKIEIKTGLESQRQFISAIDVGKIMLTMIDNFEKIDYTNIILAGDEIHITDLVYKIGKLFECVEIKIIDSEVGQLKKTCSNKLLKEKFINFEFSNLDDNLKEIIAWYRHNINLKNIRE
jgi:GDP-L-fucose synthase